MPDNHRRLSSEKPSRRLQPAVTMHAAINLEMSGAAGAHRSAEKRTRRKRQQCDDRSGRSTAERSIREQALSVARRTAFEPLEQETKAEAAAKTATAVLPPRKAGERRAAEPLTSIRQRRSDTGECFRSPE